MVSPNVVKRIPIAIGIKPSQEVTFTNKTIDGTQNTLQNVPTSALQYDSITINGTSIPLGGSINIQAINPGAIPDYSDNPNSPTPLSYEEGHINIEGDVVSGDIDYVTFTVGAQNITSLYLTHYSGDDGIAFFAIQQGAQWTAGQNTAQMLAYGHFGPGAPAGFNVNDNILSNQGVTLQSGNTYTMWIQQTGTDLTRYTFSTNLLYPGSWALTDTNTTYSFTSSSLTGGANLNLIAGGSGTGTESVSVKGGGNVTVSRQNDGSILISDGGALGGVTITDSSTNTLTNKTISGNDNSLSDIPNLALTNSSITINGNVVPLGGSITIAGGGGSGDLTASGIATLTNKTISGNDNTITNLPNSALNTPFILINGSQVPLGTNFTVNGLGDVTTTGTQDLSNKSLLAPIIQNAQILGTIEVGTGGSANPGTNGQVLKSTGTGVQWANENQTLAATLTIGSGLISSSGQPDFDGSNGTTISVNTSIVATLTGTQTLSNKTLDGPNLTGDLKIDGVSGSTGQTIVSDGAGGLTWGAGGGGGSGSFNGPATSTDNAILRYDGTTGDLAQDSSVTISDSGVITATPNVGHIIPFFYQSQLAFPNANSYHGAIAHSHGDGAMYFAHGGSWVRLANSSEAAVSTRDTFTATTNNLGNNGTDYPNITSAYKSYLLFKIQVDKAAWVRVYTSSAARSADSSRSIDVDPAPGSGVLAEIITTGSQSQVLTPAVIGFNDDTTVTDTIYLAVTNRSGTSGTVTVTLTALKLEV